MMRGEARRWDRVRGGLARSDRGTVTAEFAVVLPTVMVVALMLFSSARAVIVNMNCQDAARAAARELVVAGDGPADVAGVVTRIAGNGASVTTSVTDGMVVVTTRCPVLPGPLGVVLPDGRGEAAGIRHE
ncbi:TadE/TadG family type IV pilus assembly protein [Bifidobacterium catulorum]|nr:TadE/TadG family type IV pilus assembly protein [Bifidobacterium catulorum]